MRTGVTGIFASGKGTVCRMFHELGASVIDMDEIARDVVEPGSPALEEIAREFGPSFLYMDGTLKRKKLAGHVFGSEERVERLNSITHPHITRVTLELSQGKGIYVIDAPLLFETGLNTRMDKNIVVFADQGQVMVRAGKRDNLNESEIRDRLSHQIPLKEKLKLADYVIDNTGSMENTKRQVVEIWNILNQITGK